MLKLGTKHTATPWRVYELGSGIGCAIETADGHTRLVRNIGSVNAAHIVRCVNAHDELIAALRYVESRLASVAMPSGQPEVSRAFLDLREVARAALAKVDA